MSSKRRFKPKIPAVSATPTTMEGTALTLPAMKGWYVKIGDLWNCRTSKYTAENIFNQNVLESEEYLEVVPLPDMQYKLSRAKNSNDKSELLDISVEVKIELPAFTVEGGVSFRKEDQKRFEQEEFFVQYNAQTAIMRTRPSVQDPENFDKIIVSDVANKVKNGATATHYVSEIRYGGWATGRFRLSDNMDHNLLDLSGSVGGTVPVFPGISVGLKASISFMEKDSNLHFSKEISIEASPPLPDKNIQSIEEMFEAVETIPAAINSAIQPYPTDRRLKGIPISFKLSPLSYLIPLDEGYETYDLIEEQLLSELQDMIFNLYDFQMENYYRNLLREVDPRLVIMFPKIGNLFDPNPWVVHQDKLQQQLLGSATRLYNQATNVLTQYKQGKMTVADIRDLLNTFSKDICHPTKVKSTVQQQVEEGQNILNALHPADAALAGQPDLFTFSKTGWEFLLKEETPGIKLLLATNGVIPSGTFITFYSIIPSIIETMTSRGITFTVSVGAQNIVDGFYLAIKSSGTAVDYYRGEEIPRILKLFEVIAAATKRQNTNTSRFYSTLSTIRGSGSADKWDLETMRSTYNLLQSMFSPMNITFADSYLQTFDHLTSNSDIDVDWILFLPTQFTISSHDAIEYFRKFVTKIGDTAFRFRTIVGYFDALGEIGDAPVMILLDNHGAVAAICCDEFDLLLLGHQIENGSTELQHMNPSAIGICSLTPFKIERSLEICKILTADNIKISMSNDNPFIQDGNPELMPSFKQADELLRAASFGSTKELVSCCCIKPGEILGGKFIVILQNYGWNQVRGFDAHSEVPNWTSLKEELSSLINQDFEEDKIYLQKLIDLLDYLITGSLLKLSDVCLHYVDQFFAKWMEQSKNVSNLQEDIKELIRDTANPDSYLSNLLKSLKLLHRARCNDNYHAMWMKLEELWVVAKANDAESVIKTLELIATFEPNEQRWVWGNPKFQYWTSLFLNSKSVLAKIFNLFCEDILPSYFPIEHRRHLLAAHELVDNPMIKWQEVWDNLDTMMLVFGDLVVKQNIPDNFTQILGDNLNNHPELLNILMESKCLFFWNEQDRHFMCGWGFTEISQTYRILQNISLVDVLLEPSLLKNHTKPSHKLAFAEEDEEFIIVNTKWLPYTTGKIKKISTNDFQNFQPNSYDAPLIIMDHNSLQSTGDLIVPYLIAQIKQKNLAELINPVTVLQYVDYMGLEPTSDSQMIDNNSLWTSCFAGKRRQFSEFNVHPINSKNTGINNFLLSTSDLLTLILNCSDEGVQNKIILGLTNMSPNLHALPWFIPDISKDFLHSICLSKSINLVDLREYFQDLPVMETRLLSPAYKLITAIRVGHFKASNFGKSTILNTAVLKHCQYSYKFEPGYQNGLPISRDGLVELAWLCEFTAHDEFFDKVLKEYYTSHDREMVLLANVHGDILKQPNALIENLKLHSEAFLIFWGCSSWKEMKAAKFKLDTVFGDFKTVFNIVLDPDSTIKRNIDDKIILDTSQENSNTLIEGVMKDIINKTNPTIHNPVDTDDMIYYMEQTTIETIRRSLKLQNHNIPSSSDLDKVRTEMLHMLLEILTTSNSQQRNIRLWRIHDVLQQISTDLNFSLMRNIKDITSNFKKLQDNEIEFIIATLRAARHELNLSSLTLTNLFRELNLEGYPESNPAYLESLQNLFLDGFPMELLNINFLQFDPAITGCLGYLEQNGIKFITVSVLGPQGSFKTSMLNKLFSPGLIEGPFGTTNGVMIRLVRIDRTNKPKGLENLDAILLLDSEGIARNDNGFDADSVRVEREVSTLLLSISDLCLIAFGGDSQRDWFNSLQGVMELSFLTQSSLISTTAFPDIIVIDQDVIGKEALNRNDQFLKWLGSISNLTTDFPIQTLPKYSTMLQLQTTYTRVLSDQLDHKFPHVLTEKDESKYFESLKIMRDKIIQSASSVQPENNAGWFDKAQTIWQLITANETRFAIPGAVEIYEQLSIDDIMGSMRRCYESAYSAHEGLLEDTLIDEDLDFNGLNGIPYFCTRLEENVCDCREQIEKLEQLEGDLIIEAPVLQIKLIHAQLDDYTLQLRSDIISRMTQETYAAQITKGTEDGTLANKLKEMLVEDPNPWIPFKRFISTLLNVGPWDGIINSELELEYGSEFVAELRKPIKPKTEELSYDLLQAFNLDFLGNWGQSPFEKNKRIEELESMLSWEEYIWLEIQIEKEITMGFSSYSGYGYKRGMLRFVRDKVTQILRVGFRSKLPMEFELAPKFVSDVHFLAITRFLKHWGQEWQNWLDNWDPLKLLEERKEQFPDEIFIGNPDARFRLRVGQGRHGLSKKSIV